jgi:hypothetical protein
MEQGDRNIRGGVLVGVVCIVSASLSISIWE